jgi:methionyl-tRNA formyltransferase
MLVTRGAELVDAAPYIGLPGQVQALDGGALVACGEGFVRLTSVQLEGAPARPAETVLKLHERLGFAGGRALSGPGLLGGQQ